MCQSIYGLTVREYYCIEADQELANGIGIVPHSAANEPDVITQRIKALHRCKEAAL